MLSISATTYNYGNAASYYIYVYIISSDNSCGSSSSLN